MDFFISAAHAQQGAPQGGSAIAQLLPLIVLIVLFYFMLIRPQMKRNKEQRNMVAGLSVGDEVVSSGGIAGTIVEVGENYLKLKIAESVDIALQKSAISQVLPKGTLAQL